MSDQPNSARFFTREAGETVRIGDIEVTVIRIMGRKVRLGIKAPRTTHIRRQEIPPLLLHCDLCGKPIDPRNQGQTLDDTTLCINCLHRNRCR